MAKQILNNFVRKTLFKISQGNYIEPKREPTLRASSLPFCPLLHVLKVAENYRKNLPYEEVEFKSGFYFKLGNAIHDLWQSTGLNTTSELVGDWACTKIIENKTNKDGTQTITRCNRQVKFCSASKLRKMACTQNDKTCLQYQKYSELEFNLFSISGHSDYLLKEKTNKRYHVVDFKTTGLFLFDQPDKAIAAGYYPSKKYIEQIETYCVMLEQKYKIKIYSYTIAYVSRDRSQHTTEKPAIHPFTYKFDNKTKNATIKKAKIYSKQFELADKWLKSSDRKKLTNELFESRPCHKHIDYMNRMEHGFFSKEPCEHDKSGSCYNRHMLKLLAQADATLSP